MRVAVVLSKALLLLVLLVQVLVLLRAHQTPRDDRGSHCRWQGRGEIGFDGIVVGVDVVERVLPRAARVVDVPGRRGR